MDDLKADTFQFDWTQDPRALRNHYKSKRFDPIFRKQIAKDVITVLSPQLVPEPHNLTYDDDLVYKRLIGPLERFICGLPRDAPQETVDNLLDHLKTLKQPSKMCRKVLKTGDVLFSCNDCGFDATCVVCIDCFHKSAHKDHNYRMSNTDGGGCCDCGDVEAWKQHPACSDHQASADQPNLKLSDFEDEPLRMRQIKSDKAGILDKISLLPPGYAARFFLICQASLHYARQILIWYNNTTLPSEFRLNPSDESIGKLLSSDTHSKNYFTVLFNDEVHTYDHVINTLVKVIKCSKSTASIMASSVSREGRSFILQDQYKSCKQVRDAIACVRDSGQGSLKVEVIHGSLLAHQAYALKLIEWIQRMALLCDGFRVLTAYTLLGTYDPIPNQERPLTKDDDVVYDDVDMSLLERVMRSNTDYWKQARVDWNDLFVTTLLTEYSIKDQFARLVTRNYCDLVQSFMEDDHDHSVSVLTMTTQLYTVPSLTCMLIEEENALSIITQKLIDVCRNTRRENVALSFDNRNTFDLQSLKRGFYIIADIRHLINIEPTKWTDKLRENVTKAVKIFLNLLDSMQGMDSVKRQLGQHLEYEQEWETGMALQSRLISIISRLVNYCSLDEKVLMETLRETQIRLLKNVNYKTVKRQLFDYSAQCIQYDVSASPVSVHLPLTRFAAALIVELMRRRPCAQVVPYDESLVILTQSRKFRNQESLRRRSKRQAGQVNVDELTGSEEEDLEEEEEEEDEDDEDEDEKEGHSSDTNYHMNSMIDIMEPSLRTAVMIAQFRSGMWRRNGFSLVNQIGYLTGALMRKEMFDRDILVLQECAATCEANKFIIHLLNKFNLFTWVNSELTREPLVGPKAVSFHNDEEIMTQTMTLGEEFLQLLLTIISERYRVGVGKIQEEDVMKNELIQLLCIGSFSRSDITQKLFVNDNEIDCIKTVANLRRSSESSTGKYELKEELYDRFNPFFYHYSRRNQSHALDAQLKRKRNAHEQLICCPPPRPVELSEQFRNLNELLRCNSTLIIIQKILRRASNPFDPLKVCSTGAPIRFEASHLQLDQCLHLIGLGLHEQERNVQGFNYVLAAHEKNIFELMRDCYTSAKRSQDLIFWLTRKANALIGLIMDTTLTREDNSNKEEMEIYASIRECFEPVLASCDAVKQESKRNSELAAQRRARIMAMMKAKQNRFLENPATKQLAAETAKHEQPPPLAQHSLASATTTTTTTSSGQQQEHSIYLPPANEPPPTSSSADPTAMDYELTNTTTDDATASVPGASCRINTAPEPSNDIDDDEDQSDDDDDQFVVADDELEVEEENTTTRERKFIGANHLCILCREEQNVGFDKPTMVLLAYVQRSAVLSKNRSERRIPNYSLTPSNQLKHLAYALPEMNPISSMPERYSFTSDNSWSFDATLMPADLFFGPYISTCGHLMHYDCWKSYSDAVTKRETTRLNRGGRHISYELEKDEILCPLCECISNATIPMLPDYTNFIRRPTMVAAGIFGSKPKTIESSSENLTAFLHALKGTVSTTKQVRHLSTAGQEQQQQQQQQQRQQPQQQVYDEYKYTRLLQPTTFNDVLSELDEREALMLRDFIATIRRDKIASSLCTKNLLTSIRTLAERIHSNGLDLDKSITDVHHARIFMMTSWSISYSIQAQERTLRFKGWPLFEGLGSAKNLCLESLVRFACTSMMTHQSDMIQSLLVQKLRYLLISEEHLSSSPCCLDIDAFELFVSIYITLPKLYCHINNDNNDHRDSTTGAYNHEYFRNLLHLMVIFNLLQVLITLQNDQNEEPMDVEKSEEQSDECVVVQNFFKDVILASGHPNNKLTLVDEKFVRSVKCALLPFLRSCAIFLYQMSQIEPSEVLKRKSAFHEGKDFVSTGESTSSSSTTTPAAAAATTTTTTTVTASDEVLSEFKAICEYLNLPNEFSKLLRSREARNLALTWLRHSRVLLLIKASILERVKQQQQKAAIASSQDTLKRVGSSSSSLVQTLAKTTTTTTAAAELQQDSELMPLKFIRQPHAVNKLIDLPYDYSELVDKVKYFSCPSIKNKDSLTPTLCLVCGVMLCSQSYCCQRDLNDLASNYKQVLKRQEESRQQWQAAQDSLAEGGPSVGGVGGGAGGVGGLGAVAGYYPPGSAMAAANDLHSTALAAISRLFPQRSAVGTPSGGTGSGGGGGGGGLAEAENRLALRFFGSHIGQQLVGSCTYHAYECSGGVGVFLRIRNCQILLLSGRSKGCYMAAPYIDDHGETDFGLQRGAPLHLARLHYERLQHSWLNHTIPEQISRILQNSSYASNTQWHLH